MVSDQHMTRPRETSIVKGDRKGKMKYHAQFFPDCLSQWTRENKMSQRLGQVRTKMTACVFGGKTRDTPPERESIKNKLVEGFTEPGCESGMVNTLPNV
jgi:hypothetical protein